MIKLFIPEVKVKSQARAKSQTRGFWINEQGKIYYDYLKVIEYKLNNSNDSYYQARFLDYLDLIKASYKQEAIYYIEGNKAFIYYNRDKIEVLNNRITITIHKNARGQLRYFIREYLKLYKGLTIYKDYNGNYLLEAFYN